MASIEKLMQAINSNDKNMIANEMTHLNQPPVVVGIVSDEGDAASGGPITGWFVRTGDGSQNMLLNCFLVTRVRENGSIGADVMNFEEIANTIGHRALHPSFAQGVASFKTANAHTDTSRAA